MTEYEARIRDFASGINEIRGATGATPTTLMFALMSVLLSKNKITDRDIEIIFDVELKQTRNTMMSYFEQGYGDPDFEINNEEELKDADKFLIEYIENIKENVRNAAAELKSPRSRKKAETTQETKPEKTTATKVEKTAPPKEKIAPPPKPKPPEGKVITEGTKPEPPVRNKPKKKTKKDENNKPVQVHL